LVVSFVIATLAVLTAGDAGFTGIAGFVRFTAFAVLSPGLAVPEEMDSAVFGFTAPLFFTDAGVADGAAGLDKTGADASGFAVSRALPDAVGLAGTVGFTAVFGFAAVTFLSVPVSIGSISFFFTVALPPGASAVTRLPAYGGAGGLVDLSVAGVAVVAEICSFAMPERAAFSAERIGLVWVSGPAANRGFLPDVGIPVSLFPLPSLAGALLTGVIDAAAEPRFSGLCTVSRGVE
jgi:hypothetical protein